MRENVAADQVFVTGNTGIDALQWAAGLDVPIRNPEVAEAVDSGDRIVLVTAHRRENWGGGLERHRDRVSRALAEVASRTFASSCRCIRIRSCVRR